MTLTALILLLVLGYALSWRVDIAAPAGGTVRKHAHRLTLARWHSEREWQALDQIIRPESGWNPCSSFPSHHDCSYAGANSCGVPQANPCPKLWRGRLWETRFAQVRWLLDYVARRYGTPSRALAFRRTHGYY